MIYVRAFVGMFGVESGGLAATLPMPQSPRTLRPNRGLVRVLPIGLIRALDDDCAKARLSNTSPLLSFTSIKIT